MNARTRKLLEELHNEKTRLEAQALAAGEVLQDQQLQLVDQDEIESSLHRSGDPTNIHEPPTSLLLSSHTPTNPFAACNETQEGQRHDSVVFNHSLRSDSIATEPFFEIIVRQKVLVFGVLDFVISFCI